MGGPGGAAVYVLGDRETLTRSMQRDALRGPAKLGLRSQATFRANVAKFCQLLASRLRWLKTLDDSQDFAVLKPVETGPFV